MHKITEFFPDTMSLSYWIYPSSHPDGEDAWTVEWFQEKVESLGFTEFEWIENTRTDTQSCLCVKGDNVFLTFRGSSTDDDWTTNFDFELVPCPFGQVHKGFWSDAGSVYYAILHSLIKHIVKNRDLVITGHSQGAGVACCTAIMLLEQHRDIKAVIHYGGPRVADFECADYLLKNYPGIFNRVVNNNDVVTRVPPRIFGYKHFGKFHYFRGDGTYTEDISEWGYFLDRMRYKVNFGGKYGIDILNDHVQGNYLGLVGTVKA